jgi:chemotaxis family two-component system sensor kinase Cph1
MPKRPLKRTTPVAKKKLSRRPSLTEENARLRDENSLLRRANQELEQFSAVAAHDLQSPLRKISNFAEILAEYAENHKDERVQKAVEAILGNTDIMSQLIRALLNYARAGKADAPFESISLDGVLRDVMDDLQELITERKAHVSVGLLPRVEGNAFLLYQLIFNLIKNALVFSDSNPVIRVEARRENSTWVVSVQDQGVGISTDDQTSVFQPFRRLHPASRFPGAGMGLAVCQRIIDRHAGKIWVESTPGLGSKFFFSLPATQVKVSSGEPALR